MNAFVINVNTLRCDHAFSKVKRWWWEGWHFNWTLQAFCSRSRNYKV